MNFLSSFFGNVLGVGNCDPNSWSMPRLLILKSLFFFFFFLKVTQADPSLSLEHWEYEGVHAFVFVWVGRRELNSGPCTF